MKKIQQKQHNAMRRRARVRSQVAGTAEKPRLSVYRSNQFVYAQLIDDASGITLVSAHDMKMDSGTKLERAHKVGMSIAEQAQKKNITSVVFDRGGRKFWGRVKAVAEGARSGGLQF